MFLNVLLDILFQIPLGIMLSHFIGQFLFLVAPSLTQSYIVHDKTLYRPRPVVRLALATLLVGVVASVPSIGQMLGRYWIALLMILASDLTTLPVLRETEALFAGDGMQAALWVMASLLYVRDYLK